MPILLNVRPNQEHTIKQSSAMTASKSQLRYATKTRRGFAIACAFLFFISLIFLILCDIGNVNAQSRPILGHMYMFKMDTSNIVPASTPHAQFYNSLAQTIGLHDFYQVGMWNFCAGYDDSRGITYCSTPTVGYWFDPVHILLSELLAGAKSKSQMSFSPWLIMPMTKILSVQ